MANNKLKYLRIDAAQREQARQQWNQAIWWPVALLVVIIALMIFPAIRSFQHKAKKTIL